jgi:hypothetical protein
MFTQYDPSIFADMQDGKPFATYRKTILGKVCVSVLNPFDGQPILIILEGDPKKSDKAFIDTWNEREDLFFRRQNARLFEIGSIIADKKLEVEIKKTIEQFTDDELRKVINTPYLGFKAAIEKLESEATLYRILMLAKEMEKSNKIVKAIESRLSFIQLKDLRPLVEQTEPEEE